MVTDKQELIDSLSRGPVSAGLALNAADLPIVGKSGSAGYRHMVVALAYDPEHDAVKYVDPEPAPGKSPVRWIPRADWDRMFIMGVRIDRSPGQEPVATGSPD
jgi:hypothetical protein